MKNWHDEDLILHLYREHPRGDELEHDLAARADLRERFEALRRDLAAFTETVEPEPRAGIEERIWARLRPRLDAPAKRSRAGDVFQRSAWRFATLAALLLAAVAGAFLLGQRSATPPPTLAAAERPFSAAQRERLLLASVAGHLESSSLLLTDLSHAPADQNLTDERRWAVSLLASNRLYRQAAARAGQRRIVALLDELDPLLVELANAPAEGDVRALQHRIDERDLLFKVRVVGSRLQTADL